jgi:cytoskeletal protein RodZ
MDDAPQTMGAYLHAARRRRRIGIERAAEDTRIRQDYLMRMESDEFDFLAPAYVRGFLKTYARFLRVNVEPLLEEFDRRFRHAVDTSQLVALERHRKRNSPKERRLTSSWAVAAIIAAATLLILGIVGLVSGDPDEKDQGRGATLAETDKTPTPTPSGPTFSPTPTLEATTTPAAGEEVIAFTDGIELVVTGAEQDCWVDITADGVNVFSGTIVPGQSETFTATEKMQVVLGYAAGVELMVNGNDLGSPGIHDVLTFELPADIDTLL